MFRGCVQEGLFRHVHEATIAGLAQRGMSVTGVKGQVCCGALAAHAGDERLARELASENVRAFAGSDEPIVVNSAGCGAMLKSYPAEFAARVRDISELLSATGNRQPATGKAIRVAYDAPCHLIHAQRVTSQPLDMLAAVPGVELVPLEGSERCCGSAGLYSMIEPAMSQSVLKLKLDAIRAADPDFVATGNPGCIMHIGAGLILEGSRTRAVHPVELLGHP